MRNSRTLVLLADAVIVGRTSYPNAKPQTVPVAPSPESGLHLTGTKCEHGVYIPGNSLDQKRALHCSCCYPYIILAKKGSEYKA